MADMTTKILTIDLNADKAINGIINLNNAIEKNTSDIKANNAMIAENNKKMKESGADVMKLTAQNQRLAQSNVELEAKTKALKDEKRVLQKETQNEIKLQTEEIGSMKQLEAELRNLKLEYKRLSEEERTHGQRGIELRNKINETTTSLKKAEFGIQEYYRNVGNYQNAILSAIGMNGRFGQSIMNITNITATSNTNITQAFSSMGTSIKAFGASLMGLLTNPVFLAIAGIAGAGMAFKWFYDYNNNLAEATRLTREFTGYTGDNLIAMRNSIQATADVMGKDFNDTLKTADALMANFHIDGQTAMDIINKGFASGADVNGDFLQKAQQLAPTFHDAGIEADQMVAIISQTRSGIFTDQGLEAIRQGSARIREMSSNTANALKGIGINVDEMQAKLRDGSMSTFEAIQQVSAQLKTLPDNAKEVGEVMTAVFGRQGKFASQEMIESLAEMSTSLDEVTAKTGEYGELLLENIDTEEELDNVTSALFDMTDKGWEEAKQQASIYAKKALVAVVKGLIDVANWFVKLYNNSLPVRAVFNGFITQFKMIWNASKLAFNLIIDGFKAIGRAINAVVNMFSQAGNAISAFGKGVYDILAGIANRSLEQINRGWTTLKNGVSSSVKSAFDGVLTAFTQSWSEQSADWVAFGKEAGNIVMDAMENTINGRMNEISIPAWAGGDAVTPTGGVVTTNGNSGTSKGGKSKGASKASKATPKTNTTTTAKQERDEELERQRKLYEDLLKQAKALEKKALDEQAKISVEGIDAKYKAQEEAIRSAYSNLNKLTADEQKQANEIMQKLIDANTKEWLDALAKRSEETKKAYAEQQKVANEKAKQLVDASLEASTEGTDIWLKWRLEQLRMAMEAELAMVGDNSELRNAIIAKYEKQATQIYQENAKAQMEIQAQKYNAISTIVGGLAQVLSEAGENQKEFVILQKTLATAEIMIAQAVAIANAIKDASQGSITVWDLVAKIATGVTAVTVAMMQAFNSLDSAKFAVGGYIQGAGTSTSDSIPIRVSNGESVMNANTTAMFGGLLSSLNQLGGGVPIQAQNTAKSVAGEDMLARAFAKGVAMLPNPVVSVQDINRGQRQVEVLNERALL